jgi:MFS family permease
MGGGQPIGFGLGLTLGGVLTDSIGWRWGFYISAIFDAVICAVAFWGLPKSIDSPTGAEGAADLTWAQKWRHLKEEIDWVGAGIATTSLAMLSYVFAYVMNLISCYLGC